MNREEDIIQIEIVKYFQIKKHYCFSIPNEAIGAGKNKKQAAIRGHKLKLMGRRAGVADLFVAWKFGGYSFIEVKSSKGRQSPSQRQFEEEITGLGIPYFLVRSLDEVIKIEEFLKGKKHENI